VRLWSQEESPVPVLLGLLALAVLLAPLALLEQLALLDRLALRKLLVLLVQQVPLALLAPPVLQEVPSESTACCDLRNKHGPWS